MISIGQLQQMHSPQMVTPNIANFAEVSHTSYGLGWFVESYRGNYHVHHGGTTVGFSALVSMLPQKDIGIVVLTNLHGTPLPQIIVYQAIDLLLGLEPVDWNERLKAAKKATESIDIDGEVVAKPNTTPSHRLEDFAGKYQHPIYGTVDVRLKDEKLAAVYYQTTIELEHQHYDVFRGQIHELIPLQVPFQFITNLDGSVNELRAGFEPTLAPISFTRQPDEELSNADVVIKLAGTYNVMGQLITIEVNGDSLIMKVPGQPSYNLEPGSDMTFNLKDAPGYSIQFKIDEETGEAKEIIVKQPRGDFKGIRQ